MRQIPGHGSLPVLEDRNGLPNLRDDLFRRWRVDHDDVSRIADLDAVVLDVENARRSIRNHMKAVGQLVGLRNLKNVGEKVRNPDEGTVAVRRGRVHDVV